jgi:signal recognition particle GTPase
MGKLDDQEKEIKHQLNILNCYTEEELDNHNLITLKTNRDVCLIANCTLSDIQSMMQVFEQMRMMHNWILEEVKMGHPLPKSNEELSERIQQNPQAFNALRTKTKHKHKQRYLSKEEEKNYRPGGDRRRL